VAGWGEMLLRSCGPLNSSTVRHTIHTHVYLGGGIRAWYPSSGCVALDPFSLWNGGHHRYAMDGNRAFSTFSSLSRSCLSS